MPEDDFLKALEESATQPPSEELHTQVRDCWFAIKAAAETIGDYCGPMPLGINLPVEIDGVSVATPPEIMDIANSELPREERITAIMESDWCRDTAASLCERLFGAEPGTSEHNLCVETTARRLAMGMIT